MPREALALLLRLNKSWYEGMPADELDEITRAWWVMSGANAQRVVRVLAVAGGIVREVYEPAAIAWRGRGEPQFWKPTQIPT